MKIVIIGNGAAAIKALDAIATYRTSANAEGMKVTVIAGESTAAYAPMFLLGYLTGELGEEELFASLASAKLFSSLASASEGGGSGVAWPGAGLGDASQAVWVASSVARLSQS